MAPESLPSLNAGLNAICAVLLLLGYAAVRQRRIALHKTCMLSALLVSAAFLTSYLYYHFAVRGGQPTYFSGQGPIRLLYFLILLTHTVLAALVAPLAITTAIFGLTNRIGRHVRLAR